MSQVAREQQRVTRRYDRMAWLYDVYDALMEYMGTRRRRRRLVQRAQGAVLEVGVGTGKNLRRHAPGLAITGTHRVPDRVAPVDRGPPFG